MVLLTSRPEAAVFDDAGRMLAVTSFGEFDDPASPGWIDFWRVVTDPLDRDHVELVRTRHSIAVGRGAMQLNIPGQR